MRNGLVCFATAAAILCFAGAARAVDTLAYSFETIVPPDGPDGFFGLGATVTQDTIGATHLLSSMKYDVGAGGFVGARTQSVIPLDLNDPPGVDSVIFDMFVPAAYAGTFADIGVTLFGHQLNAVGGPIFGQQVQFADTEPIAGKAPGQYLDLKIDLNQSVGPYRAGESFNQIFGPNPNDLTIASAFQFFISKNSANPVTVYIDNVRLRLTIPEPASIGLFAVGALALTMCGRRRAH